MNNSWKCVVGLGLALAPWATPRQPLVQEGDPVGGVVGQPVRAGGIVGIHPELDHEHPREPHLLTQALHGLGDHTQISFTALPPAIGAIKDGSLRGIALLAKQRAAALPDLPTNIEEGVPGLESDTLTGIVAPAGTPKEIVDKWNAAIVKMLADPAVKQKLDTLGFVPVGNSPAEFAERIKSEAARWDKVVKAAGIHMD